jgi:tetratricopeptide (TPR) repeat protein
MRRSTGILCIVIAAALWCVAPMSAQPSAAWLKLEEGKALFEQREFGRALQRFQEAVAAAGTMPEAEMGIGDVYREEGELGLAQAQYEKAYNNRNSLAVPAARYDILYRLAGIYEDQEFYKLMEDTLLGIVADDANWAGAKSSRLRTQLETNYYSKGMNQVLKLYRFDPSFAQDAHAKLGWFYYRTGRFSSAVLHCLYAAVYGASEIARYLREHDVEWDFSTFEDLLGAAEEQKDLHQYVADSGLYRNLYYLAGSTYASMYPRLAQTLWRAASRSKLAGEFADLSGRQLKKPWIEPYLVPVKKAQAGK